MGFLKKFGLAIWPAGANIIFIIQGVPLHIRSSIGLNNDFRDLSENLRKMSHFEKFNKANLRIYLRKIQVFSRNMVLFWRYISEII